jgi:hypothetical protein
LAVAFALFAVVLVASVTNASAQDITYDIVATQATDEVNMGQDTIYGTIITDGNMGTLTTADIVGGSFSIQNSILGACTAPLVNNGGIIGGLDATPTSLTLAYPSPSNPLIGVQYGNAPDQPDGTDVYMYIQRQYLPGEGVSEQWFAGHSYWPSHTTIIQENYIIGFLPLNAGPPATDPWIIATAQPVPEPATLTLLASALSGLGVVYLRRRRGANA